MTTKQTLDDLKALRRSLEFQRKEVGRQVGELDKQIQAAETIEQLLLSGYEITVAPAVSISAEDLQGLTQPEALTKIAQANGGRFKVGYASKLMLRAGLIKTKKNATTIIFNVMQRTGKFEREAPGMYRLATTEPLRFPRFTEAAKNALAQPTKVAKS